MKKTLIALMALAGIASADATALTGADFNSALTLELERVNYDVATWDSTYHLTCEMNSGIPYDANGAIITLSAGYYLVSQAHSYFGLNTVPNNSLTTDTGSFTFTASESNVYTYTSTTNGEKIVTWARNSENSNAGTRSLGNLLTLNLVYNGKDTVFSINYGGSDITDTFVWTDYQLDLSQVELASGAGLKSMSVLIPEPATATLSLLALCGLAARRRRK